MIDAATIERWMREANPISDVEHVEADEFAAFVAATHARRAAIMQAPTRHPTPTSPVTPPPTRRRRRSWAFAAGFAVILLAVGAAALLLRSDGSPVAGEPDATINDSLTWTRVGLGSEGPSLAIAHGGSGLIGVGVYHEPDPNDLLDGGGGPGWVQGYLDLPTLWTSPDGYEWSRVPDEGQDIFDLDGEIADIAAGDAGVVAVTGHLVWHSPDGLTWSRVPDGTFTENADSLHGVIAGGPGFIAYGVDEVTNRTEVWTSPDGQAWTQVPDDPEVFDAAMATMTLGGPGLVATGVDESTGNPVVWTSPDGYTWTRMPYDPATFGDGNPDQMFTGMRINDVAASETMLVAVGIDMTELTPDEPKAMAAVWTSRDGVTWSRVPHVPALFEGQPDEPWADITGVAAVGEGFVAVGSVGEIATVWTSPDGLTWTKESDTVDATERATMEQVIAGGPGVIILGVDVIEDYTTNRPPLVETVLWIGSTG